MIIGIDARKIDDSGIGRYIRTLLNHITAMDKDNQYCVYLNPPQYERYSFESPNVRKVRESAGKYGIMEHLSLPMRAYRDRLDLFHSPHYTLPLLIRTPSVVTVHDLIHLLHPPKKPFNWAYHYAKYMIKVAVERARAVITVSENTKNDLIERIGARPEKISVIHSGVEKIFKPVLREECLGFLQGEGLPQEYILHVGNHKPHKNILTLIKAFGGIKGRTSCHLLLCGSEEAHTRAIRRTVREEGLEERVRFLGHRDDDQLVKLYSAATALVFPSLYEGFGFPILEAMACGTPVITSDVSSMKEVAGGAALLINPHDLEGLASAISKLTADPSLRKGLTERGFEQVKRFQWEKTAEKTLKIYHGCLEGSP